MADAGQAAWLAAGTHSASWCPSSSGRSSSSPSAPARWRCRSPRSTSSDRGAEAFQASGDWLLIAFGWGFGVAFAVWVAGGVSGAHLNPAVTLAQALRRGFPWAKVPTYWAAQVLGAFAGAALIYLNYHDAIAQPRGGAEDHARHRRTRRRPSGSSAPPRRPTSTTLGRAAHRPGDRHRLPGAVHLRAHRRVQRAGQGATSRRSWSASSWSRSASPSAPTPATRSTPPATSARGCSPGSRAGRRSRCRATTATSTPTSGSRSSGPLVGGAIGAFVYDLLIRDTLHGARRAARPGDRGRGPAPTWRNPRPA